MYSETPAQLVAHLTHPNGWWRDTAQRLLVLKQDKSVVPALQQMARPRRPRTTWWRGSTRCGRSKGSARSTRRWCREAMKDKNPRMRVQAIRASETLYKAGDKSLRRRLSRDDEGRRSRRRHPGDADGESVQAARRRRLIKETQAANKAKGVAAHRRAPARAGRRFGGRRGGRSRRISEKRLQQGSDVFGAVCFACHGDDGMGGAEAGRPPAR